MVAAALLARSHSSVTVHPCGWPALAGQRYRGTGCARADEQETTEGSANVMNRSKRLIAAACLAAGTTLTAQALAQDASQPSQPAIEAPALSEQKLQSFAVAFVQVEQLKQQYMARLQEAGSESEQQEIRNEAGQSILQAVEQADGISVDEYNQIIRSAQSDPELAQKLSDAIRQVNQ